MSVRPYLAAIVNSIGLLLDISFFCCCYLRKKKKKKGEASRPVPGPFYCSVRIRRTAEAPLSQSRCFLI